MEIGNRVESVHQLEVEIGIKKEKEIESYKVEVKKIIEWGEESIELYRQRGGNVKIEGDSMLELWEA